MYWAGLPASFASRPLPDGRWLLFAPPARRGGRLRIRYGGRKVAERGRGRRIINLLFSRGVFESKFRIFRWVRVEGLRWHR